MAAASDRLMALVLVAEDDDEMRRLVVEGLRKDGHTVHEACDGGWLFVRLAEAIRRNHPSIECIVSDVYMPACSTLDLLESFSHRLEGVPLILMTAFADREVRRRAEQLGAFVVEKPFPLGLLRDTVWRMTV
jgi:CheY-like chemotaxis protein